MSLRRVGIAPLITRTDIPDMAPEIVDPSSVFNPGAITVDGTTHLLLRVQTRGRRTFTVPATGDGLSFKVADRPTKFSGLNLSIFHNYDPRITKLGNETFVTTALDTEDGCRLAIWRPTGIADDFGGFTRLELVGMSVHPDTRNGVVFPDKVDGRYLMLERPNRADAAGQPGSGTSIVLSATEDWETWEDLGPVMSGRPHYWDELIGPGPPPIKTREGWLMIYHGIATHFASSNIYQAGAVLLDLDDPRRVIARTRNNILEPREPWELAGQVPNVVFPSGWTVASMDDDGFAPDDAEVRIYYGAADTVVGLAVTTIGELIAACQTS
jgi:beta-1,4-mannooligosaccharide/beta-1,4-mannosyl-N-acetylglucosamine phosphorylase